MINAVRGDNVAGFRVGAATRAASRGQYVQLTDCDDKPPNGHLAEVRNGNESLHAQKDALVTRINATDAKLAKMRGTTHVLDRKELVILKNDLIKKLQEVKNKLRAASEKEHAEKPRFNGDYGILFTQMLAELTGLRQEVVSLKKIVQDFVSNE